MTKNQIDYMSLQENKRHNQEMEAHNVNVLSETKRSNIANESEAYRSNRAREDENYRHNYVSENLDLSKLSETKRHNLASEHLDQYKVDESIRHNKMVEQLQNITTLADKAYKESQSALRQQELSLAQRKEVQRISESLRDFNEAVRRTNLQSLTSKGLVQLVEMLGTGGLGLAAGTGAAVGGNLAAGTAAGATAGYLTGPKSNALFTTLSNLSKNVVLVPKMLTDLANEKFISPNSGSRGGNKTYYY